MRVLVVCLGNICRSPMAEGWLIHQAAAMPELAGRFEFDSAGLGDWHAGQPPDPRAIVTAAGHGVDISRLRARQLQPSDFRPDTLILCADATTLSQTRRQRPPASDIRVERFLEWAGAAAPYDLADPYQGGPADFEDVWTRIEAAGPGLLGRLQQELGA